MATFVSYPGQTGAQTEYSFPFSYVDIADVRCEVNGVTLGENFYAVSGSTVTFHNAPVGDVIIRRVTGVDAKKVTFAPSSPIRSADLNLQDNQFLFALQELVANLNAVGAVLGTVPGDLASTFDNYLNDAVDNSAIIDFIQNGVDTNAADIAQEISDRTAAIAAEASSRAQAVADEAAARLADIAALQSQVTANASAVSQEVSDRQSAVQTQADALQQEVNDRIAAVAAESSERTAAILAEASTRTAELLEEAQARGELARRLDAVYAEMAAGFAAVVSEVQANVEQGEAFAQKTEVLAARIDDAEASVLSEQTARIGDIADVEASLATGLSDEAAARTAAIAAEAGLRAGDVAALTTDINLVRTDYGNADSAILSQLNSLSSDHVALASQVDSLEATFISGDFTAAINSEATARSDADSALAERIDLLTAESGENIALAFSLVSALTAKDESTTRSVETLKSSVDGNIARIDSELLTLTTDTSANATSITSISASLGATQSDVSQAQSDISAAQGDITQAQADIVSVNQAVVDEAAARASDVSTLQGQIDDNSASITSTSDAISTRVDALAREQTQVSAEIAGALASLVSENEARADEDEALSTSIFALNAEVADNLALILSEQTARADGDSANATAISALDVRVGATETGVSDNAAAIASESTARADGDSANATAITALDARLGTAESDIITNAASILTESSVRADALAAISRDLTALRAEYAASLAWSVSELETRADENEAVVTSISAIQAEVSDNTAAIVSEQTARADGDSANATAISALDVRVGATETGVSDNAAAITDEATARANADSALTTQFNGLSTSVGTAQTDIASLQEGQSTLGSATTRSLDAQIAQLAGALAGAFTEIETRADENSSTATRIDQLSVNLQDNYATVTELAEVSATADKVEAMYGVRIDANGYVSGFGLSNDGAESEFAVLSDRFLVAAPGSGPGAATAMFVVDAGNVYMNNAFIANLNAGTITTGEFGADRLAADSIEAQHIKAEETWTSKLYLGTGDLKLDGSAGNVTYTRAGVDLVQIGALGAAGNGIVVRNTAGNMVFRVLDNGTTEIDGAIIKAATINQAAIDNLQVERVHLASGALGAFAFDDAAPSTHSYHTNTSVLNTTGFTKLDLVTDWVDIEVGDRVEAELFYSMQGGFNAYEWLYFQDTLTLEVERENASTGTYYPSGYNKKRRAGFASNTGAGDGSTPSGTTIPWDFTNRHAVRVPASGGAWWNGASGPARVRAKVTIQAFAPHGSNCASGGASPSFRSDTEIVSPQLEVRVFALS